MSRLSTSWACALIATCGLAVLLAGCDAKAKPLTSATSQFKVAGEGNSSAAVDSAAGDATADAEDTVAKTPDRLAANPVSTPDEAAAEPTIGGAKTKAPAGKAGGNAAALLAQLDRLDPRTFQPQGRTEKEQIEEFIGLLNQRLGIAKTLLALDPDKETKQQAIAAAMESFAFFNRLGVQGVTAERLSFARLLSQDSDPEIARMGRFVAFGVKLDQIFGQPVNDGQQAIAEIKKLLDAEKDEVSEDTTKIAAQGVQLLMEAGLKDDAVIALEMIAAACKKNPELADQAQVYSDQAQLVKSDIGGKLLAVFKDEEGAEQQLLDEIKTLLDKLQPTEQVFAELNEIAFRLEVIGKLDAARQAVDMLAEKFKDVPDEELAKKIAQSLPRAQKRLSLIGQPFVVEGELRDGSPFDWSAYAGKIVLLDFWATWCGPCLDEIPNIKQNYELFHDKGFEVVGINLNTVLSDYDDFFETQELPWPSVMSAEVLQGKTDEETPFQDLPLAKKAGVEGIPFVVLIGKDGKVDSIHVRGPKLKKRLTELLGAPAGVPAREVPADPTAPREPKTTPPAAEPAADPNEQGADLRRGGITPAALLLAQSLLAADDNAPGAEAPVAAADDPAINPYKAKPGLTTTQLVAYIERMLDRAKSIQARPGFTEAVAEACDRVLAADPPAKEGEYLFACECKCEALHRRACAGDDACDQQLIEFVKKLSSDDRPRIARLVAFYNQERKAIDGADIPLEQVPALLTELDAFYAKEKLEGKHLRMASSTVAAINRLEDGDEREKHFAAFGDLFSKSRDKELARYGKKLANKPAIVESDLAGKPLELVGQTAAGGNFTWDAYRGKVVIVDFWATWCGPCRREMPKLQAFYEQHKEHGFEVVGVSVDEDLEALAAFLDENQIAWETLAGEGTHDLAAKYAPRGYPTMVLVDKEGKVAGVAHSVAALTPLAHKLLKGESGAAPGK